MGMRFAIALLALVGCAQSNSTICGKLVCVQGSVCSPAGDSCATPSQLNACEGKEEAAGCSFPGEPSGSCKGGVCLPVGCGNGVIEPQLNEVCDDGNRTSFDGCSADCTSAETCGDGAVDPALGEQCDCGAPGMTVAGCLRENSEEPGSTCRTDCRLARCGDGIKDPHEACDDHNVDPGDGCRADCMGRWTQMVSGTYVNLRGVWADSPTNAFAVGEDNVLLHYDGVSWSRMASPSTSIDYNDVWGTGSDVFAAGGPSSGGSVQRVDHFDGTAWSNFALLTSTKASAIGGRSAQSLYVAGATSYRYNAGAWTAVSCALQPSGTQVYFNSVWVDPATGSTSAWLANDNNQLCRTTNGSAFSQVATTGEHVWGTSASDLWSVSDSDPAATGDVAWHSTNGSTFTAAPDARLITQPESLSGVADDVVIVGRDGSVIVFDGTAWNQSLTGVGFHLRDVYGYAKGRAFIVGDNGTILY